MPLVNSQYHLSPHKCTNENDSQLCPIPRGIIFQATQLSFIGSHYPNLPKCTSPRAPLFSYIHLFLKDTFESFKHPSLFNNTNNIGWDD